MKATAADWLGDVPEHWSVDRLKWSAASCRNGIWGEEPTGAEDDTACVRVADFDRTRLTVRMSDPTIRSVTAKERSGRTLAPGNLLLEKSGGGEGQPVGVVVLYQHDQPAVCSNFVARIELADDMNPSFWRYVHAAAYAVRVTTRSINQTSGIQNLDQDRYFNELAPFPPLSEQTAIAAFLDRETGKIDALVEEQRRLIELLKEKRHAVISHAVTKGLDPNAKMKPSGVEWLGDVPEHWEVLPVKRLSNSITSGPRGWSDLTTDDGHIFFQSQNIGLEMDPVFDDCKRIMPADDAESRRAMLMDDDVVVCITGARTGAVAHLATMPEQAFLNQHVCLVRPEGISGRFLAYSLSSLVGQQQLAGSMYGLKQGLALDNVRSVMVALPPAVEQGEISGFLDRHLGKLAGLTRDAEECVRLLGERRAALISAAVTGKIDVRAATSGSGEMAA